MANKTIQLLLSERYSKPFPNAVLDLIEGGISVFANKYHIYIYIDTYLINPGFILITHSSNFRYRAAEIPDDLPDLKLLQNCYLMTIFFVACHFWYA